MKVATNIKEQIALLKQRGMLIPDEDKAREVLNDIGYYRLGFYWSPFEMQPVTHRNRQHRFKPNTTFTDALRLYYFDLDLRECLARYLYRFELSFRRAVIHEVSRQYKNDPTWFSNPRVLTTDFESFVQHYNKNIKRNEVIKRHHRKHRNDIYAPAWKTLEFLSFGEIQIIYEALKDKTLKLRISLGFITNPYYHEIHDRMVKGQADKKDKAMVDRHIKTFQSYIDTIRRLRNQCAHHHPLFDFHLHKPIAAAGEYLKLTTANNSNLQGCILLIKFLITPISKNRVEEMVARLKEIANKVDTPNAKESLSPLLQMISTL